MVHLDEGASVAAEPAGAAEAAPDARPAPGRPAEGVIDGLRARLAELRARVEDDPFVNPIKLLALDLLRRLQREEIGASELEAVIQRLTAAAFRSRAANLGRYLGQLDPDANAGTIAALVRAQATGADGERLPFRAFADRLHRIFYGLVVTAHPTFSLAVELQERLAALAIGADEAGRPLDGPAREALLAEVERLPHRPPACLDLDAEHEQSLRVLRNLRAALDRVHGIALDAARELYPDAWRSLRPRLVSVASWVGYDMDGRSDIGWTTTFAKRLAVQLDQLRHYVESVTALRARASDPALTALLELIEARLGLAVKSAQDELELFAAPPPHDGAWRQRLARASRGMAEAGPARLGGAAQLLELVERALALAPPAEDAVARGLCVLRAELETQGLGAARSHMRINAVQLHNAIRKTVGMEHAPDDPTHRLTYLREVERLIGGAEPVKINFGSVMAEKATAKRVFMTMAQVLKHVDAGEPLRFLIAECETAFTLLTALYFARMFGLDDRIDISPLFETGKALERGAALIEEALSVKAWRDYLRRRGRLCIQTGFSDAGRYIGQPAAAVAIERIRLRLVDILRAHGLADLEVVIFDTHGESIGRGAHPSGFADRLRYFDTPESRRRFAAAGVALREESSFQGGDGYLFFLNPTGAFAVVTRVLEHVLAAPGADETDDPFYLPGSPVDEFFAAVARFNATVIDDPSYAALLGAYNVNLLYPTGSRSLKRQEAGTREATKLDHPSKLRAIPHNSILQQLGILANVIGGVGQAVDKDPDGFHRLYRESPRFRRLMSMVEHAFKFTDPDVVLAYLDLFNPETWLRQARLSRDPTAQEGMRAVADYLDRIDLHDHLARIYRVLHRDYMDLSRALREHRRLARDAGERPIAVDPETRDNLHALHALRLALIQRLMLRAIHVPDFSDRHAATHEDIVIRLMRLDVEPALAFLSEVFPLTEEAEPELDFGEPATYRGEEGQSYRTEHMTLFRPIGHDYELIRRIGSGIVHHIGAVG